MSLRPADPSLGAVGAGSNAGPHFFCAKRAASPRHSDLTSGSRLSEAVRRQDDAPMGPNPELDVRAGDVAADAAANAMAAKLSTRLLPPCPLRQHQRRRRAVQRPEPDLVPPGRCAVGEPLVLRVEEVRKESGARRQCAPLPKRNGGWHRCQPPLRRAKDLPVSWARSQGTYSRSPGSPAQASLPI